MKLYLSLMLSLLPFSMVGSCLAADSVINITGTVQANTCTVSTASQNMTVDLSTYASKNFSKVGSVSPMVPFSLDFSSCGGVASGVKVGFTGVADSNNSSLLEIDSGDSTDAQGIGIEILDNDQTVIPINQSEDNMSWHSLTAGQANSLTFYARMMSTVYPVTAGVVTASATITLEFE
ncbi:fimbrial protein [Tatumella terrea]|uniref:Fimbrial protein n=1 Tax=Tatumella terrea TaxID=419007 RepID=A0ABW1VU43_9GAMM